MGVLDKCQHVFDSCRLNQTWQGLRYQVKEALNLVFIHNQVIPDHENVDSGAALWHTEPAAPQWSGIEHISVWKAEFG